jgi:16S rRNA processing protein RimM
MEAAAHPVDPSRPPSPAPSRKGGEGEAAASDPNLILLGEFGRAHGLKGEIRLKSHTGDPIAIGSYGPLITAKHGPLTLHNLRPAPGPAPDMLIAQVEGVSSREGAEALNRVELFIPRHKLPPPDEEDEFLLADLIGLTVVNEAGEPIGTVIDVPNFGGGDLLEIADAVSRATAFLPFTKEFVPVVDIAGKRVVAAPPDDLFAPPDEDAEPEA